MLAWCQYLLDSYTCWTGQALITCEGSLSDQARRLFGSPFAVVSHGAQLTTAIGRRWTLLEQATIWAIQHPGTPLDQGATFFRWRFI